MHFPARALAARFPPGKGAPAAGEPGPAGRRPGRKGRQLAGSESGWEAAWGVHAWVCKRTRLHARVRGRGSACKAVRERAGLCEHGQGCASVQMDLRACTRVVVRVHTRVRACTGVRVSVQGPCKARGEDGKAGGLGGWARAGLCKRTHACKRAPTAK